MDNLDSRSASRENGWSAKPLNIYPLVPHSSRLCYILLTFENPFDNGIIPLANSIYSLVNGLQLAYGIVLLANGIILLANSSESRAIKS